MYKFSKKKKIILGIIIGAIVLILSYYIYAKENDDLVVSYNNEINETSNTIIKENTNDVEDTQTNEKNTIVVHICGSVNKEGIVELKENSRISDAVAKAEGLKEDADISSINLAYVLEDGMRIYIPSKNDKEIYDNAGNNTNIKENINDSSIIINNKKDDQTSKYVTKESGILSNENSNNNAINTDNSSNNATNEKVNINNATQTQLETLPGIGPSTALKIINYRNENGKFKNIEDIKNVSGIGDGKFSKIKDLITVK